MKVSDSNSHIATAVVGKQEIAEMQIDNSPEFFEVLSASLYNKSPTLAFVREVISNAWDAHKEAGREGTPVEVTITNEEITFTDVGHGIPTDLVTFNNVYGTYGKGTKRNNDNAIGGFGLGCKSPIAYAHTFQVTSCHKGKSATYCITKGTKETKGKFAVIKMFEMDSDKTGLTVSVPLLEKDVALITRMVKGFTFFSDIPVLLNGELLPTCNASFTEGTVYSGKVEFALPTMSTLNIRCANVVYPAPVNTEDSEYDAIRVKVVSLLHAIYRNNSQRGLFFIQASPSSMTIHPSRESLVANEHTLEYLKGLFYKVYSEVRRQFNKISDDLVKIYKDFYLNQSIPVFTKVNTVLFCTSMDITDFYENTYIMGNPLSKEVLITIIARVNKGVIANLVIKKLYLLSTNHINKYIVKRIKQNRNNYYFYLNTHKERLEINISFNSTARVKLKEFSTLIPVYKRLLKNLPKVKKLAVYGSRDSITSLWDISRMPVVVSTNQRDCFDWIEKYKEKHSSSVDGCDISNCLVIYLPNKKEEKQEVMDYLAYMKVPVLDLTKDWDFKPSKRKVISNPSLVSATGSRISLSTNKGLFKLSDVLYKDTDYFALPDLSKADYHINPKVVIHIPTKDLKNNSYIQTNLQLLCKQYSDEVSVALTQPTLDKWKEVAEFKSVKDFLIDKVESYYKDNKKDINKYLQSTKLPSLSDYHSLGKCSIPYLDFISFVDSLKKINNTSLLPKLYDKPVGYDEWVHTIKHLDWYYVLNTSQKEKFNSFTNITYNPKYAKLIQKLSKSHFLTYINLSKLLDDIEEEKETPVSILNDLIKKIGKVKL